ncbi:MAG: agmatinase [Armatimonadota bacterium]
MAAYELEPPGGFLNLPAEYTAWERAGVVVLPVPFELSTSYGGGTRRGPAALIEASAQVELYDRELDDEPALRWGVHTLPPLARELRSPEAATDAIAAAVEELARSGKLPVILGGEHSISPGVARGLHRVFGDFVTVQLDAHADLRAEYEGTPHSHACAAARISKFSPVIQVGIRSLDVTEMEFIREQPERVRTFWAEDVLSDPQGVARQVGELVAGKRVFLTLDLDVFDASIMPSTGTPEPGGLRWHDVLAQVRAVAEAGDVIGFDCVELAPIPGFHAPDFTAAKLVYKTISYIMRRRAGSAP